MLYLLYGPDRFRAREELRAIRAELDRDGNLAHNTLLLDGRSLTPEELRNACQSASLFAEDRLVIVEDLGTRLAGARRRSGRGARREAASQDEVSGFTEVLLNLPTSTTVVLLDEQPAPALLEALGNAAVVRQFPILRPAELREWAVERARRSGASLTPEALNRLLMLVDAHHVAELAQEIDKLATYAAGRSISERDVDELVSASLHLQTWDLTDAVIEGRPDRALKVLREMDARDFPRQLLIFMIVRQYRQIMLAQAFQRQGLGQEQIGARLGLANYPLRKLMEQAGRYPPARLDAAYRRLLACDIAVKTGVLDVDVALETLIVDLAQLARPAGAAARSR